LRLLSVAKQNPTNVWAESRIGPASECESESEVEVRGLLRSPSSSSPCSVGAIPWFFFFCLTALLCMLFNFNGAKSWPWVADAKKVADATKSLPLLVEFNVAGQLGRGQAAKWPNGRMAR